MPTYDFVCLDCGKSYEISCAMSQREQARCPVCGSVHKRQDYKGHSMVRQHSKSSGRSLPAAACG